jgi:hypothetical protein
MKKQISAVALVSTLALLSANSFAESSVCKNADMKAAIKSVDQLMTKKTIQLRFNENDIKDMAELNANAQKVHKTSAILLTGSLAALGGYGILAESAVAAIEVGATISVAAELNTAKTALTIAYIAGAGGFLGKLLANFNPLDTTGVNESIKTATGPSTTKQEALQHYSLRYGFKVKEITEEFLDEFVNDNDKRLDEKAEELLAQHRNAGNGILGGKGANYTEALLSVVEARKELYTFQLDVLTKLKSDITKACLTSTSGKL